GAGAGRTFVPIVDAAVVEQVALRIENRGFWSDGGARKFDEGMIRIAERGDGVAILFQVFADFGGRSFPVGVEEGELWFGRIRFVQLLQRRRINIYVRTVSSNEDKDSNFPLGSFDGVEGFAVQPESSLWRPREERQEREQRGDEKERVRCGKKFQAHGGRPISRADAFILHTF